jgi:DNA-directed RNA polymerase
MIELSGGIMLPIPKKAKGFTRPDDFPRRRWDKEKTERWERAYLHCLYSLPLHFELPLHSVVPRLAKKMMESTDPFNVALRFMGEMELAGYVKFDRGMDERIVVPTKKFLDLDLDFDRAPESAITLPKLCKEDIPRAPIRGGIASAKNKEVTRITSDMAGEEMEINEYVYDLLKEFPPVFKKPSCKYMYTRAMSCAEQFLEKSFYFQMFLDSRSRMYADTTCGFNPQGADHEKALCIPTYKERLTDDGFKALVEAAHGYSEIEWAVDAMAEMARNPKKWESTWKKSDKPYSFMACARLISLYLDSPDMPLPAFIPLDGRCSGLQHWSAVVRSNAITKHLGMHKEEAEQDIYEKVASDWLATLDSEWHFMATRKAAKIPVMTWGYNATMMTSMEHMDKLFGAEKFWDKDLCEYVIVGDGLERAVTGAKGADLYRRLNETLGPLRAAVDWVSDCATAIAKYGNVDVRWITPDGFEAIQRKVKGEKKDLDCTLSDGSRFTLDIMDFTKDIPNTAKHRSAIAPNVIHSLDATHLRMVARRLAKLGLPMIFIHDSFATHCNHREALYNIIVETFIELYSDNYLSKLYEFWTEFYGVEISEPPIMGDWEPASLKGLRRFFL